MSEMPATVGNDLLAMWQSYVDEDLPLPKLLSMCALSFGNPDLTYSSTLRRIADQCFIEALPDLGERLYDLLISRGDVLSYNDLAMNLGARGCEEGRVTALLDLGVAAGDAMAAMNLANRQLSAVSEDGGIAGELAAAISSLIEQAIEGGELSALKLRARLALARAPSDAVAAEADLRRAIQLGQEGADVDLANLLSDLERYDEAEALYLKSVDVVAMFNLGISKIDAGDPVAARRFLLLAAASDDEEVAADARIELDALDQASDA